MKKIYASRKALIILCLLISACSHQTRLTPSTQQTMLLSLAYWQLEAKLGFRTTNNASSANMLWRNHGESFHIELFGPFGKGKVSITQDDQGLRLRDKQGTQYAESARTLLQQRTGYDVPIDHLKYWVKGVPSPKVTITNVVYAQSADTASTLPAHTTTHTKAHTTVPPKSFTQDGWHVIYQRFTHVDGYQLPQKIILTQDTIRVTMVIKKWQTDNKFNTKN